MQTKTDLDAVRTRNLGYGLNVIKNVTKQQQKNTKKTSNKISSMLINDEYTVMQ